MPKTETMPLFDEHGRCLPSQARSPAHARSRNYFRCGSPQIEPLHSIARIRQHLAPDLAMGDDEFITRIAGLRQRLAQDEAMRNVLNGPTIPFAMPRLEVSDIGQAFDERFLPAVAAAYQAVLPEYRFVNHHPAGTAGKFSLRPGERHRRLLDAMARDEVCGLYFPCLSEFSEPAALEQIEALPEDCLLSGPLDTAAALVATPDLLLRRDGYPPLLWLSGAAAELGTVGYHFEAYGYNLTFNRRAHLGQVAEYWWHGLTILA